MVLLVLCKRDQGSKWKYLKKSEKIHAEKPAFTPDPVSEGEDPSAGNFFFKTHRSFFVQCQTKSNQ